jgi:hypothetical protein
MRKLFKSLKLILVTLLVLIVVVLLAVKLFANSAVRVAVETAGTKALSVGVELDSARLSIVGGALSLNGVTVANPSGYEHDTFLTLSRGDVQIETRSLLTDEVTIKDIQLDGMAVVVEQKGLTNNLREILKGLEREGEPSGKKLYIDTLTLKDVTVSVKLLPVPGKVDTVKLKLAPIEMTNLGRDGTVDIATLTAKIILAVAAGIAQQGADVLPAEMITDLTSALDTAVDLGLLILGDDLQKGAEEIGRGITEGLKGILKSKSDE